MGKSSKERGKGKEETARPPLGTAAASHPRRLSLRELNRATLARQMLLGREPLSVVDAVRRLVGLQAQWPAPPYVGLWTRLAKFERADLARAIEQRALARA